MSEAASKAEVWELKELKVPNVQKLQVDELPNEKMGKEREHDRFCMYKWLH